MNCLRCGRETTDDHVFCDSCREEMEKYPVRPGTAVMLPRHEEETHPKKGRKHAHAPATPEEQVRKLKHQRSWLLGGVLILAICLSLTMLFLFKDQDRKQYQPGQNYSAVETTAPVTEP